MFTLRTASNHWVGDIDRDGKVRDTRGIYHSDYKIDGDYVYSGGRKVGYFDRYGQYIDNESGRSGIYRC